MRRHASSPDALSCSYALPRFRRLRHRFDARLPLAAAIFFSRHLRHATPFRSRFTRLS